MINIERWHTLSLAEQIGNIGSEICRLRKTEERKDAPATEQSFYRALDCIDATISDLRWKWRLKEIVRLREVLADHVVHAGVYAVPLEQLERYCTDFAMIARSA